MQKSLHFDELMIQIGTNLREARRRKGLTQMQMRDFGLDSRYYQRIEAGQAAITLKTLLKVCNALDLPIREAFPKT